MTQGNLGIIFNVRCLDKSLTVFLVILRIILLCYNIFYVIPDIVSFVKMCYYLNQVNTWHYYHEPFFTNCSAFNALCCWIGWSFWIVIIYFFVAMIYMVAVYIGVVILAEPDVFLRKYREFVNGPAQRLLKQSWDKLNSFIMGKYFDSEAQNMRELHRNRLINDDYYKRDQEEKSKTYFQNNKTSFKSLFSNDRKDCAICIGEFGDLDEVI